MRHHVFFHADRSRSLQEHQDLNLNENGLSFFGSMYWPAIENKPIAELTDAQLRERLLEDVRRSIPAFNIHFSRLKSIFAALTIEDAIKYAKSITPAPSYDVPIYEIHATNFTTLDMNWLDYKVEGLRRIEHFKSYWYKEITNHCPQEGERRPPSLEVQIELPAKVGRLVAWAKMIS